MGWGGVSVFLQRLGKKMNSSSLMWCSRLSPSASLLQFLPQLEEVDVSWNELIGGSLAALTSHLQQVSGIRTLRICSCRLNADDVTALGGVVAALPRLSLLDVSCNPQLSQEVDVGGFKQLASSLSHTTNLTTLRLQACGLTADGLYALGGSLRYLPSVRELDLSCNKQLSGGLSRLTCHLSHVTHLESLDLHLCCLSLSDLEQLSEFRPFTPLSLVVPNLRSVDVSWCKVVGGRLSLLLDSLKPSIILELRLSSCDLITDDLHHLASASRRGFLSSLRVLDLSYNGSVGDEGWSALFSAGGLGSLEDVDVSLRPSSSARCSAWLPSLLRALPRSAALARLALQRWTVGLEERRQLEFILRKRSVLLEWDQDGGELRGTEPEE
uniref:Leucine rich repeat containing 31 n=1 Tax=Acanthochromis polyacanthus TaxID=80966 RepID=A0A3Q1EC23_9TELE